MGGKVRVADALTSISTMHMPDPDLVWIPAQTTTLGADNDYPEEGPTREVSVDGFWMQTPSGDQCRVRRIRRRHRLSHRGRTPVESRRTIPVRRRRTCSRVRWCFTAQPVRSTCATSTSGGPGHPARAGNTRGGRGRRSRAANTIPSSISRSKTLRRTRIGRDVRCPPKPSGRSPLAVDSSRRHIPGATSPSSRVSGWPTIGTANSRTCPTPATGKRHPSAAFPPTATGCSTWPATSGSGPPTGTPPPGLPSLLRRRQLRPGPAAVQDRRKVIKGGSFLCADSYCLRYRPAARRPQMVDTGMSHIGFRCILR